MLIRFSIIFFLTILPVCLLAQSRILGWTVGQIRFSLDRSNIDYTENDLGDGITVISYRPRKKDKRIDLQEDYKLFFDSDKGDKCYKLTITPSVQARWVADTIINRLLATDWRRIDSATMYNAKNNHFMIFEYVNTYWPDGNKTGVRMLQLSAFVGGEPK